jgi:uncharacterized RDD family membrane protein YckC
MTWYYADAGRQVGPLEESALDDLVRSGIVRDDTLVWRDGMATWQPHGAVRGVRPAPPPPPMPVATGGTTAYCSECGRPFAQDQLVTLGHAAVCAQCKPIYLQRVRESGQPATMGTRRYAGFWIRFVARFIDGVILTIVFLIINLPLQAVFGMGSLMRAGGGIMNPLGFVGLFGISALINFALAIAYEAYFVGTRGGTPGKLVLGLRVINADGSQLTVGQAAIRYAAMLINSFTFFIGYIIAGFDSEKRALHDRICNTRVIHIN